MKFLLASKDGDFFIGKNRNGYRWANHPLTKVSRLPAFVSVV